jgi:hypothetical protein
MNSTQARSTNPSSSPLEEYMSINSKSIIPEPLRSQIEAAARLSPDMNIPNNDDPVDDPTVEDGPGYQ